MKIRLLSDIHQEFYEDESLYESHGEDVLVLAGDISVGHQRVIYALKRFYEKQQNIIYVPGNHEYYGESVNSFDYHIRAFTRNTNISFLNPGSVRIGEVTFIGAALWTNFRNDAVSKLVVPAGISDYRLIPDHNADTTVAMHDKHIKFIKESYAAAEGKKVIVSHFLPAVECISPQYRGHNLLNHYFANDYGDYIATLSNTTWLFGHTHDIMDIQINDTRVVCNPYGYNHNSHYKELLIDI